jgi:Protein of unknown function (DUF3126)
MSKPSVIRPADLARLQAHLRTRLDCDHLWLDRPSMPGGTVQLRIGAEVVGTVDQVIEEGERSWVVSLIVLEDDLPPA